MSQKHTLHITDVPDSRAPSKGNPRTRQMHRFKKPAPQATSTFLAELDRQRELLKDHPERLQHLDRLASARQKAPTPKKTEKRGE